VWLLWAGCLQALLEQESCLLWPAVCVAPIYDGVAPDEVVLLLMRGMRGTLSGSNLLLVCIRVLAKGVSLHCTLPVALALAGRTLHQPIGHLLDPHARSLGLVDCWDCSPIKVAGACSSVSMRSCGRGHLSVACSVAGCVDTGYILLSVVQGAASSMVVACLVSNWLGGIGLLCLFDAGFRLC
jgi:hypothetical protein